MKRLIFEAVSILLVVLFISTLLIGCAPEDEPDKGEGSESGVTESSTQSGDESNSESNDLTISLDDERIIWDEDSLGYAPTEISWEEKTLSSELGAIISAENGDIFAIEVSARLTEDFKKEVSADAKMQEIVKQEVAKLTEYDSEMLYSISEQAYQSVKLDNFEASLRSQGIKYRRIYDSDESLGFNGGYTLLLMTKDEFASLKVENIKAYYFNLAVKPE